MEKKRLRTLLCAALLLTVYALSAQNVVVNGSFETDEAWIVYNGGTPDDPVYYDFPYTADRPTLGSGNACLHFYGEIVSGGSWINGLIWQPVNLVGGNTYVLDAAWKYVDGNVDAGSWFQIYVSQEEPVDGKDWTPIGSSHSDRMYGFNSWSGCSGLDIDGLFMDEACDPNHTALYRAPADPGQPVTVFLGLKTGAGWGGTYFEILVDDISFRRNLVVNGDFEDAEGWAVTGGAAANKIEATPAKSGNDGPALGKGKYLELKGSGGECDGVVWQTVQLIGGAEYGFNAGFRHISGALDNGFWCLAYVSTTAPVEGQTWQPAEAPIGVFSSQSGASGSLVNGTFRRDGSGGFGKFIAPGNAGETVTAYLGFRVGCTAACGSFDVTIDDASLVLLSDTGTSVSSSRTLPAEFELAQNYPNPFNPSTTIRYTVPRSGRVNLTVYNLFGQPVAVLVDGVIGAGTHEAVFNGEGLTSGIYLCSLKADGQVYTRRMVLIK